jgi:hypothetical protein
MKLLEKVQKNGTPQTREKQQILKRVKQKVINLM